MNKMGSHVDVIISFIIFVSFIVFFYVIIQPTTNFAQDKSGTITYLHDALIKNMTGNLISITILTNYPGTVNNHLQLSEMVDNLSSLGITSMKIVVANSTGAKLNSQSSTDNHDLYIDTSPAGQNKMLLNIYYSPLFNIIPSGSLTNSQSLVLNANTNSYTIGSMRNLSFYLLDFNIINFIQTYNNNYSSVKEWFNLSPTDNFGFNFTYQNLTSIGTNDNSLKNGNVYSQLFPVLYLNGNSSLESGSLTIRVW